MILNSVQNKILFWIVVIATLCGVIAVAFTYSVTLEQLVGQRSDEMQIILVEKEKQVTEILDFGLIVTEQLADLHSVKSYLSDELSVTQDEVLLHDFNHHNFDNRFSAIFLMDYSGNTLVSTAESFVGKNYSFRPYFKDAIAGEQTIYVARGVTSGEVGYYFAHLAENEQGDPAGVIVMKMRPEFVTEAVEFRDEFEEANIMFLDEYGVVIDSNRTDWLFHSLGELSEKNKRLLAEERRYEGVDIQALGYRELLSELVIVQSGEVVSVELFDEDDNEHEVLSAIKVNDFPLYLVTEEEVDAYYDEARASAIRLVFVIAFAVLLFLIATSLIVRQIFVPLKQVKEHAEEIAKGNLERKIEINRTDEFGDLAEAFKKMIQSLREGREEIEKKVEEQTKDIQKKNNQLNKQRVAIMNVLQDVQKEKKLTEQQADELKKFELAVENASDHIVIADEQGSILFMNEGAEKITGYTLEEVKGQKVGSKENWGGNMDKKFYEKLWETVHDKQQVFIGEIKNRRKDGREYEVEAKISPIVNGDGSVHYFVAVERDITKAKEVDRMKSEFVSVASHQLRTPLSAIRWYGEMLLTGDAGELSDEQHEFVDQMYDSSVRMIKLVNSLLNVSRIETGRIQIDPEPTDIGELIQGVTDELKLRIEQKNITVAISVHPDIKDINVDPKLIREVYANLITNAVKYTPEGGEVTVLVSQKDDDILTQVTDNGYGIPDDQKRRIFTRFFRADNIIQKDQDGTGLGLYITKAIVESSGGKVWFESEEEKGTTFWFTVPKKGMKKKKGDRTLAPTEIELPVKPKGATKEKKTTKKSST